jgi:putative ABC transport system permease protein
MSYHVWTEQYSSDPSVVGATYQINGSPFTVVGVTAPGFFGAKLTGWRTPDFWMPLSDEPRMDGKTARLKIPNANSLDLIERRRPGTDPKVLEVQLRLELRQWLTSHLPDIRVGEREEYLRPDAAPHSRRRRRDANAPGV